MNFIITKDEYLQAKKAWTQPGYHHDAADHIIYNAIRGHDLQRGFSPITDERKLQGGFSPITDERKLQGSVNTMRTFIDAKISAAWMIREYARYAGETPERTARRNAEDKTRFDNLGLKFGITFTPELLTTLRELLK